MRNKVRAAEAGWVTSWMVGSMVALPNGFSAAALEGSLCKASREIQVITGDYIASVLPAPS